MGERKRSIGAEGLRSVDDRSPIELDPGMGFPSPGDRMASDADLGSSVEIRRCEQRFDDERLPKTGRSRPKCSCHGGNMVDDRCRRSGRCRSSRRGVEEFRSCCHEPFGPQGDVGQPEQPTGCEGRMAGGERLCQATDSISER